MVVGIFEENYLQTTKISIEIFGIIFQNFNSIIVWCFTEVTAKLILRLKITAGRNKRLFYHLQLFVSSLANSD